MVVAVRSSMVFLAGMLMAGLGTAAYRVRFAASQHPGDLGNACMKYAKWRSRTNS